MAKLTKYERGAFAILRAAGIEDPSDHQIEDAAAELETFTKGATKAAREMRSQHEAASHTSNCNSEDCLGQCRVR